MHKYLVRKLLSTDFFWVLQFGISVVALVFALRDTFFFERLTRGIVGLVCCCVAIGFLMAGFRQPVALALLAHYLTVLISAQIDTDLALVHLNFKGSQLFVAGYHSLYRNVVQYELKPSCPRVIDKTLADNIFILQYHDYCQFVIDVGTENYTNHVLLASLAILPLALLVLVLQLFATQCCLRPETKNAVANEQSLSNDFSTLRRGTPKHMISSLTSNSLNGTYNFRDRDYI